MSIRNLQVRFGAAQALRGVKLSVEGAEVLGVVRKPGGIIETGPSTWLLTAPAHAYTRSLLAAVPTLSTDRSHPLAVAEA